ncbi:hypothetical protein FVF58_09315 [Paraburkholderia panacisoli]|uniref:Uncharacterized protein n=1 Tax=Paraburkholderia panacisoli TaxID=2603818 RepID=A0A5B0HDE0_9BURK|nr:hypothetical protein [Paraburkholderia panacisoli]KAA1012983.1 hypothetical protein FVF58_09315 [Paraburkholderia panacisoli]
MILPTPVWVGFFSRSMNVRFHIHCVKGETLEMVGDPVDLPNNCGETFVVHFNPFFDKQIVQLGVLFDIDAERFRVTHVGTGFRVAGGDTIDEAIGFAIAKMKDAGEEKMHYVLDRARATLSAA